MSWRFRQSFKVIPGLRLNLSRSGISASIGGAPFTVNVGARGVSGTASIPGTGISFQQHLGPDSAVRDRSPGTHLNGNSDRNDAPTFSRPPSERARFIGANATPIEEIRSASTELLTSDTLQDLKRLMTMTFEERESIGRELGTARPQQQRANNRYRRWADGFLFRRLFKNAFARRQAECEVATAKLAELEEQLRLTTIATCIEIDHEQAEPYFRMRDSFASLCECAAIWDVMTHQATDKFHERTTADLKVTRQRVRFALGKCDLVRWEQPVPHLGNSNGGDMFLYPGFILYRAAKTAFSVIDYHDVKPQVVNVSFQEIEEVPSDSRVIGQTWAKANKDGSRDRRFANNKQIPVALYGGLSLKSTTGLYEEFHLSNPEPLIRFVASFESFVASFSPYGPPARLQ